MMVCFVSCRWVGYIKEYDGGTLMECYLHPAVNYRKVGEVMNYRRGL